MVSEITPAEQGAFLEELEALCRKHRILVEPCNCVEGEHCAHVLLSRLDDPSRFVGYKHDPDYPALPDRRFVDRLQAMLLVRPQPKPEVPTW